MEPSAEPPAETAPTTPAPAAPAPSRWAHLRAGTIALVVFVHFCQGAPRPRVNAASAAKPAAAEQIHAWAGRLGMTPEELTERLIMISDEGDRVRQAIAGPPWKIFGRLGFEQRWALFSGSRKRAWRMSIAWRAPGRPWTFAYRVRDPEHRWNARQLDYRRIRGVWNPGPDEPRPGYGLFVDWVARTLCADVPEAREVRVRHTRVDPRPPGEPASAQPEYGFVEYRRCAREATP